MDVLQLFDELRVVANVAIIVALSAIAEFDLLSRREPE
jgi:hypothetical protein